jgi:CheY-like chemotaxis protein
MAPPKFLLVEDSPVVRLAIKQALKSGGVAEEAILEADTASKAAELFKRENPEVAFVDINLPLGAPSRTGSDSFFGFLSPSVSSEDGGTEAARYMMARNPGLKLIVCTGNPPDDPRVRELVKAGAFHVLQKPIRASQIRDVLDLLRKDM